MMFVIGYLLGAIALGAYCYDLHRRLEILQLKILQLENAELKRFVGVQQSIADGYQWSEATRNDLAGYRVTYNHFTGKTVIVTHE